MVSGEECYKAMTDLEQGRWMRNVIRRGSNVIPSNTLLGLQYHNFCDFIEMSFDWSSTKEGTGYWAMVCEKYKLHDQLTPTKNFSRKPPKTF